MPAERTTMRQVREVLRLKFVGGVPTREIARRIGVAACLKSVVDFSEFDESDTGSEPAAYRYIHCKYVRRSNGILAPPSAQTMAPMSQRLRRLV